MAETGKAHLHVAFSCPVSSLFTLFSDQATQRSLLYIQDIYIYILISPNEIHPLKSKWIILSQVHSRLHAQRRYSRSRWPTRVSFVLQVFNAKLVLFFFFCGYGIFAFPSKCFSLHTCLYRIALLFKK